MTLPQSGIPRFFLFRGKGPDFQLNFRVIRSSSLGFICLVLFMDLVFSTISNLVVFQNGWLTPIAHQTNGLIQPGLLVYLVKLPLFAAFLFFWGQLRPVDIGLKRVGLASAVVITVGLWLILQGIGLAFLLFQGSPLRMNALWAEYGAARMVGVQVANLTNVVFEEIFFRGFLAVQVVLLVAYRNGRKVEHQQIFFAILLSQAVFSLSHLPNRVYLGVSFPSLFGDLFQLVGIGSLLTIIFFRSGNLYLSMGIHMLANWPMALFLEKNIASALVYTAAVLILVLWKTNPPANHAAGGSVFIGDSQ